MSSHSHHHGRDQGSVGEEAARLLEAVQEWARRTAGAAAGAGAGADGGADGGAGFDGGAGADGGEGPGISWTSRISTDALECQLCPVCRLIAVVRGTRPEVVEHLADATASLAAALRDLLAAGERDRTGPNGVKRIDIG